MKQLYHLVSLGRDSAHFIIIDKPITIKVLMNIASCEHNIGSITSVQFALVIVFVHLFLCLSLELCHFDLSWKLVTTMDH